MCINEEGIYNMKTTKESVFEYIQKELMTNPDCKDGISTNAVATHFNLQRSNVSTLLNELVKEGRLDKTNTRPVLYSLVQKENPNYEYGDKKLIGANGSLAKALQIAKAAIFYPQNSLNVLVSAKPGCGITHFVYTMYLYAKEAKVFKTGAPFFKINCRHFSDNISELDELLFKMNSKTTDELEKSYFGLARGGMLFIDNADMLNARQKAVLADFLEAGILYTENRKEYIDCHDTFLVLSCSPNSISQFSQKIPMVIELPELKDRPLQEQLDLINYFFSSEAHNASRNIELKRDVLEALMLTEFKHNIKDLELEIKKACATACVRVMDTPDSSIEVTISDFSNYVQRSLMRMRTQSNEVIEVLGTQNLYIYDSTQQFSTLFYNQSRDLYQEMNMQYKELSQRGINSEAIHDVINNHVSNLFREYNYYQSFNDQYDIEQLSKIVDPKIIHMVQKYMNMCKEELQRDFKSHVFYGLCLHMNSLLSLQFNQSRVDDAQVKHIIQDYPKEYAVSAQFAQQFKAEFGIDLPMEEIVIITMFLIKDDEEDEQGHPNLLYIFHGSGVARSLKEVTNTLTHCNNAYSYDLLLDKDSKTALDELRNLIKRIDNGQGIIVIYDMGSIKTMLDTISEEMDIKIRYIYFPITLVGLDVARKCMQEDDLDYVYHTTLREMDNMVKQTSNRKDIIITLCHTGEGGAFQLKQYIDQYSNLGIKTVPLAISKRDELISQVMDLKKIYNIHCFVGSYDPKLMGIPFISMTKIFENKPEDIDRILMFEPTQSKQLDYAAIYSFLEEQLKCISISKLKSVLPSIIDEFEIIYALNADQKVGLFVHIACLLENCKQGITQPKDKRTDGLIEQYSEDFKTVSKILKPLEKAFKVIIDDNQIAIIIMILNKL